MHETGIIGEKAVGSASGCDIDAYHIDTVRKLDPHSACVLMAIGNDLDILPKAKHHPIEEGLIPDSVLPQFMEALAQVCLLTPDQATWAGERLIALGLIKAGLAPASGFMPYNLTGFGAQLLRILYPDGRKPDGSSLRAFLKHYSEQPIDAQTSGDVVVITG